MVVCYNEHCKNITFIQKEVIKMNMPMNPVILLSYVNTQLRDNYVDLDDLCKSLDWNRSEIIYHLLKINYEYNENCNQFKLKD